MIGRFKSVVFASAVGRKFAHGPGCSQHAVLSSRRWLRWRWWRSVSGVPYQRPLPASHGDNDGNWHRWWHGLCQTTACTHRQDGCKFTPGFTVISGKCLKFTKLLSLGWIDRKLGSIQVLRNAFYLEIGPPPTLWPPRNAKNIGTYTFVTVFPKNWTCHPICVTYHLNGHLWMICIMWGC